MFKRLFVPLMVSFASIAHADLPFKLKDIAEALVTRAEMTRAQEAHVEQYSNVTFLFPQLKVRGEFYSLISDGQTADVFCALRGFARSSYQDYDRAHGTFVYIKGGVPYVKRTDDRTVYHLKSVSCVGFQKDRTSFARALHTREGVTPSPFILETVNGLFEALQLNEIEARLQSLSPDVQVAKATLEFDASVSYFEPYLKRAAGMKPLPAVKSEQKSFCRKLGFSSAVYEESSAHATQVVTCK